MNPIRFGAQHLFQITTHTTIPADRLFRQNLKTDLGNFADRHSFGYSQDEFRGTPDDSGRDFVTQITLDTGRNSGEYLHGQLQANENAGDKLIRTSLLPSLSPGVQYESLGVPHDQFDMQ